MRLVRLYPIQAIAIQIHNPLVSEDSPAPSVIDKPLPIIKTSRDEQRLSQTYTAFVKPVKQSQLLKITPTLIEFAQVEVNKASCKWFIICKVFQTLTLIMDGLSESTWGTGCRYSLAKSGMHGSCPL